MNIERALEEARKEYQFRSNALFESIARAELAFLAMLDHFFKKAPGTASLFSKGRLKILDVGCGTMPYAMPLKAFFEGFGRKRETHILGIDNSIGAAFARADIEKSGAKGIRIESRKLQDIGNAWFDVITCFSFHTKDAEGFLRKVSALLDKGGLLLMSFDLDGERRSSEPLIQAAGFEILHKAENPFEKLLAPFMFQYKFLCLARKKS